MMRMALLCTLLLAAGVRAQEARLVPLFKPRCIEASVTPKEVRPGGQFAVTLRFRNDGVAASTTDWTIFVHLESEKTCEKIVSQADHLPSIPTTAWDPGRVIVDGAWLMDVPAGASDGTYYVHVGVYAAEVTGWPRFSDQYVGEIKVSRNAPVVKAVPPTMSREESVRRRSALSSHVADPLVLENDKLAFSISKQNGAWSLTDKATGEVWYSNPQAARLGEVRFRKGERAELRPLNAFLGGKQAANQIELRYHPGPDSGFPGFPVRITLLPRDAGISFSYDPPSGDWQVESIRLLDNALWATDAEKGYMAIPYRLGIMLPANEGLPSRNSYTAYSNFRSYSMAMLGVVKNGSALLGHWDDPYAILETERSWPDLPNVPGHGMISASLVLRKSARSFTIRPLGRGGYAEIAKAYREVARERGFLRTLREKKGAESVVGAADFKPFVFSRVAPNTRWNQSDKERLDIGYSFDEAAQVAEHLRNDLGIDKAMFVLAGWIHRGYDNQHPDILPAAPECGGNEALADCARRVKKLGYLFGLHDNYQDMYKDAPSWDESYLLRRPDGSIQLGGVWAGGQAYVTCSRKAVELAKQEQNLPAVKKLFGPTIYFIDTTFAASLLECTDPEHPLTMNDDMHWKRQLCDYARDTFGLFGSEEGQEWAVPCADYFEGLMSHRTQRGEGEIIIPLFEMVYGDCINLYSHQGDRATPDRPSYILDHILYAEMPVYHFGAHLYFKGRSDASSNCFSPKDGWAKDFNEVDRLIKNTYEVLSPLCRITAHRQMTAHAFLTRDRKVERSRFGETEITVNYGEKTFKAGSAALPQYGFLVESPAFIAFHATEYAGREFSVPTMMTARSLDGKPLAESQDIKLYRAFGDRHIRITGRDFEAE